MVDQFRRGITGAALLACLAVASLVSGGGAAAAQKATPVPQLDLNQYLSAWYVQAWIPTKPQKRCATNANMLYAVGDGKDAFQMAMFCQRKDGNTEQWDANGKVDKAGGGKLKLRWFYFLSTPHWVVALGPGYEWAVVGTPNHKKLWVLSKQVVIAPELLAEIERQAKGQGFDTGKLVTSSHSSEASENSVKTPQP